MATTATVRPNSVGGFDVEVQGSDGTTYVGSLEAQEGRMSSDLGEGIRYSVQGMDDPKISSSNSSMSSSNMNQYNYLDDSSGRRNEAVADPLELKRFQNSYKSSSIVGSESNSIFPESSTTKTVLGADSGRDSMELMEAGKGGRKRRTKGKVRRTKRGGRSKGKRTKRRY
jgi:hypothetical protein